MKEAETRIYYYAGCETCRKVLALIKEKGIDPEMIEYMDKAPLTKGEIQVLIQNLRVSAHQLLRKKAPSYTELGLENGRFTESEIIEMMVQHPELLSRPIVVSKKGSKLCRPAEVVQSIL